MNLIDNVQMDSIETRPIGRPRNFDEDQVLIRLVNLFWSKGYSQTSLADIVETSGMHKPSLYRVFGGKDQLFARVLRRYQAERMALFAGLIEATGGGIEGVHEFIDKLVKVALVGGGPSGCLLITTSTELAGTTPELKDFGPWFRDGLRQEIRKLVLKAEPRGKSDTARVRARTETLVTLIIGLDVIARGAGSKSELKRTVSAIHDVVDSWR